MTIAATLAGIVPEEALASDAGTGRWASLDPAPEAVVRPASTGEVVSVLEWAGAEGVGVVPTGSGRSLAHRSGSDRFIVLATDRLTGLEVYEPADLTFTARAGTPLRAIDERLRAHRQWLPFDPPAVLDRTLGGLVAVGDSGPLWMGYGALRNHVLGMTVVTGDGRVLGLGGRVVKNVAGFDLLKPLVGSRGRLAVITSVCMRAFPEPAADRALEIRGRGPGELASLALGVGTARVLPVSSILTWAGDGAATLTVRLHGSEPTVEADRRMLESHLGRPFERTPTGAAGSERQASSARGDGAGDAHIRASHAPVEVVLTFLPSHLAEAVDAIVRARPASVSIDTYAARARVGLPAFETGVIGRLRDAVESLGGALTVERAPVGADVASVSSTADDAETELVGGIARVFDPGGVLWQPER